MKPAIWMSAILFCSLTCCGQHSVAQTVSNQPQDRFSPPGNIVIGAGDLLNIDVVNAPELTLKVRVNDSGTVRLPLLGDMRAAGLTVEQVEERMSRELVDRNLLLKPQVTVFVAEYATQGITVLGEVNQPGTYPMFGPHRLFDAISAAGGLTQRAGSALTIIHAEDTAHPLHFTYKATNANVNIDVELRPGDTIVVDKASVIYVVGEVNKPGAFLMENNTDVTVLRAVALANGPTHQASLRRARIVRRLPTGIEEIDLPLDKIMHGQVMDSELRPDDILFLPTSKVKVTAKSGAQAIIAATVGMVTYGRL